MDKHREQFDLARRFAELHRKKKDLPVKMTQCYALFKQWHSTVQPPPQYPPLNEYQFRTTLRKPYRPRKVKPPKSRILDSSCPTTLGMTTSLEVPSTLEEEARALINAVLNEPTTTPQSGFKESVATLDMENPTPLPSSTVNSANPPSRNTCGVVAPVPHPIDASPSLTTK